MSKFLNIKTLKNYLKIKNYKIQKFNNGFTLIELLVVVAIGAVMAVAGFSYLGGYRVEQNLKLTGSEVLATVKNTQQLSKSQQDGKKWGIRFFNPTSSDDYYSVFSGTSFDIGAVSKTYYLGRNMNFGNPGTSTIDVSFNASTGNPSQNQIISLNSGRGDGFVEDIIMNTLGIISSKFDTGLVGYWHFDEGTSTIAYDASGMGNNGTLTNSPTWQTGSNCKSSNCLSFTAASYQHVIVANNDYLKPSTITVSAWFNTSDKTLSQRVISKTEGGDYQISLNENSACGASTLCFLVYISGVGYKSAAYPISSISNSTWNNVTGVYDGNYVKLYFNGLFVSSSTQVGVIGHSVTPFCIGSESTSGSCGGGSYFSGKIDEVRVYNRALSATEIADIYNSTR